MYFLRREATQAYLRGDFAACTSLLTRADAVRSRPSAKGSVSQARCLARAGNTSGALEKLQVAVQLGYRDVDRLEEAADFKPLTADARWRDVIGQARRNEQSHLSAVNRELMQMFEADQAERQPGAPFVQPAILAARDEWRLKRVREIQAAGGLKVADDYFHAAMILQHGGYAQHFRQAHDLALRAAELDPEHRTARWLAAAAKDRELQSQGKPQRYGTQFRRARDGAVRVYKVDPTVTDDERAEWEVPPLAETGQKLQLPP